MWETWTHKPCEVALQAMIAAGVLSDPEASPQGDWPGFVDAEADLPDEMVLLTDQTGRVSDRDCVPGSGLSARHFGLQVLVRARTSGAGGKKAQEIRRWMEGQVCGMNVSIAADSFEGLPAATFRLHCFSNVGDVISTGEGPGAARELHSVNAMIAVRQLT